MEKPLPARKGKFREYYSLEVPAVVKAAQQPRKIDHFLLFAVFSAAFLTRFYKLPYPQKVVFDETHFGGFAKNYYDGEFFVDVHPPLGKLLFYGIAVLFGWNGEFGFNAIGDTFDKNVPYIAMRGISAASGVVLPVLAYLICRVSACRPVVAAFAGFLLIFENLTATQTRFILLDGPLLAFLALSVFCYQKFATSEVFTKKWVRWLILTGLSLGMTVSTKLTGLAVVLWVWLMSVWQIFEAAGDLDVSGGKLVKHVIWRLFGFVLVPLTVYCGVFSVHFMLLTRNGSGSGAVSPRFKVEFTDSGYLRDTAVDVLMGSEITIKHHRLEMYLHSHEFRYKTGSGEQQVSMYGFDDDGNNEWVIETPGTNYAGKFDSKFRAVKDGLYVKLKHKATGRYLRANDVRPPNSEHDYSNEVSCAGNETSTQDSNYEWRVRIIGRKPHAENNLPNIKMRATELVFQLVHKGTNCILMSHDTKLPEWGFNQNQVLCMNEPNIPNTLWYVELNSHPVVDKDHENYPRVKLPPMLLYEKLLEYHRAMYRINKLFVEEHAYASLPYAWPFVVRGINFFSNSRDLDESGSHVYFLGNVPVYYAGVFLVAVFLVKFGLYVLRHLNPFFRPSDPAYTTLYYRHVFSYLLGWFLFYFPFYHMSRQLFAHHYLPSVFFSVLALGQFAEFQLAHRRTTGALFLVAILAAAAFHFWKFHPLVYGLLWNAEDCLESRWLGWDFDCAAYK